MTGPWIGAFVVLWVVVLVQAFLLLGVFRRVWAALEEAQMRLGAIRFGTTFGGAAPGTLLPHFEVYDRSGLAVPSEALFAEPAIALLVDHDCEPCTELTTELEAADGELLEQLIVVADEFWDVGERPLADAMRVFHQRARSASQAFQSSATPQAFAVAAGGTVVAHAIPNRLDDLRRLAQELTRGGEPMANRQMSPAAMS